MSAPSLRRPMTAAITTGVVASALLLGSAGPAQPTGTTRTAGGTTGVTTASTTAAQLVAVRAHHHPGFDRVAFVFAGAMPAAASARYVNRLVADPSGLPVRIAGGAILQVRFTGTAWTNPPAVPRRTAFALPNVMTAVRSGAFEGITTFGVGLLTRTAAHVRIVPERHRVLVDVGAAFPTVTRAVYLFSRPRFLANREPFFVPRLRPVRPGSPARDALQRLLAGPLPGGRAAGLRLIRSGATGVSHLRIADRIAWVRLTGGCSSHGSTVTIAGEIMPTLRQFPSVRWVKIESPSGQTADPTGHVDSLPDCLNP